MYATDWKPVRKLSRKLGPVWVVRRTGTKQEEVGFFKYPTRKNKKYVGHLIANELISCRLAQRLDLETAEVELARIKGRKGIVSIARPARRLYNWNQLNRLKGSAIRLLEKPDQLLQTFVFDIWICNVDRHGGNLITFRKGEKYSFYLIDHGLALGGALKWRNTPWDSAYWEDVWTYNRHYVRGLLTYVKDYRQLKPFVKKIEALPQKDIEAVVDSVPDEVLPEMEKLTLKKMLLYRQKRLRHIIKKWFKQRKNVSIKKGTRRCLSHPSIQLVTAEPVVVQRSSPDAW
ncbi:MAG: hypothetical protein H0Z34_04195 [Brevibacillus sp.]|nr:hypothetical protein [Brevibacillus sp.]